MVDINLLKDTKGSESEHKPPPLPPTVRLSSPGRERLEEKKAKPPSGFALWLKGLFSRQPKIEATPAKPKPAAPPPKAPKVKGIAEPEVITTPVDIFEEVQKPTSPPPRPKPPLTRPQPKFDTAPHPFFKEPRPATPAPPAPQPPPPPPTPPPPRRPQFSLQDIPVRPKPPYYLMIPVAAQPAPGQGRPKEKLPKPPSGFLRWLKNLFAPKPKAEKPVKSKPPPAPQPPPPPRPPVAPPAPAVQSVLPPQPRPVPPPPPPPKPQPAPPPARPVVPPPPPPFKQTEKKVKPTAGEKPKGETAPARGAGEAFFVNLLPEEFTVSASELKRHFLSLGMAAVMSVVAVLAVYFLLELYQTNIVRKVAHIDEEITQTQSDIQRLRPEQREAIAFTEKVGAFTAAAISHVRWTNFFEQLEKYSVDNVSYGSVFKATVGGSLAFDGTARSIDDVAHFLAVLQREAKDFVTSAKLQSLVRAQAREGGEAEYTFSISVTLVDGLWLVPPGTPLPGPAPVTASPAGGEGL